jgi:predicted Zn-dependent peptidase
VHLPEAFDAMHEMVGRPRIAAEDLENERQIVLEEIAMYEDDPQDKVFDVLGEAIFGSHPLGRAVIGHADVVAGSRAEVLRAFHAQRYGPHNVVLAAAGSVDHDALVELAMAADGAALPASTAPLAPPPPNGLEARVRFVRKDTEQYHVCLGAPGIARDDERRWALRVLDNVLGGTSSSRLFQEVRERRGLAYSVYSFSALHAGTGQVGLYVGTRPDNVGEALKVVGAELERFVADPATDEELARSKENVKGRTVLALESTSARMNRLGSSILAEMPLLSVDEIIERVDAVTVEDVKVLAAELFANGRLSAAGVGGDEDRFRSALGLAGVAA